MIPDLQTLPSAITAPRTDSIYNGHAYLIKVPVAAIRPFIETFIAPGETVVDFFAGSGMTGLAAVALGRNAILSDISVLGQHIATGYIAEVSSSAFLKIAAAVIKKARAALGDLYAVCCKGDNAKLDMTRTVWSFTYRCPACDRAIVYYEHISPSGAPPKRCPSCGGPLARRNWPRGADVPVEVVEGRDRRLTPQPVSNFDRRMIAAAAADLRQKEFPLLVMDKNREMYSRSGLGKAGMTETAKFFSPRNAIALLELWRAINAVKDEGICRKLRFAFTAILSRPSRRYQWGAKRPLNAQNQTYYIAPIDYEWNVFELFQRKVDAALRADEELFGGQGEPLFRATNARLVSYELTSADRLSHLRNESVDYIFIEPPFGSSLFYSDMSLFHEAWLGRTTDNATEAVVHTTGRRKNGAAERYEALLRGAFSEAYRVLKPGRYMSVVFGNSSGRIWELVQRALRDVGFKATPAHVAIFDKGQRSVKGLNSGSEGVITVDLIITVQKPVHSEIANDWYSLLNGDIAMLIREAVADLALDAAKNPSYVYADVLTTAIQKHVILDGLHLGDVLVALRQVGYAIDKKSGLFHWKRTLQAA